MSLISDLSRKLRSDGQLGLADVKSLLEQAAALPAEATTELASLVSRFRDAFDADGWKELQAKASTFGVSALGDGLAGLADRPELSDVASGKKTLSTASGRHDPGVVTVQRGLMALARLEGKPSYTLPRYGCDGDLGAETTAAVKAFQADRKLPATGVVDAKTVSALSAALANPVGLQVPSLGNDRFKADPLLGQVAKGGLVLAAGAQGAPVTAVQQALVDLGYAMPKYGADGSFGNETRNALTQFQQDEGLPATGRLDKATLNALDKAAPPAGAKAVNYPEYDQMLADGVLDVTLGLGFDEDGSHLWERKKILDGFAARGFTKLDLPSLDDAALTKMGLDPKAIDREGAYYFKEFEQNGRKAKALVKFVEPDTASPKQRFAQGFAQSDLVLYAGHARYGSGPDFDTKESTDGNLVLGVNAAGHRTGALTQAYDEHMRQILKDAPNDLERTKLTDRYQLMFFSGCSTKNYLDELRGIPKNKSAANLDVIGSNDPLYWNNLGENVLGVLDGVMAGRSENDLESELFGRNQVGFTADGFGGNRYHP